MCAAEKRLERELSDVEKSILRLAQGSLPDSATPYADMAAMVSSESGQEVSEQQVIDLLQELKDVGAIRRFGATLRHQKAGWAANVMVAWICPEERMADIGPAMAAHERVSHCYHREPMADWPYSLFTMVHGRSKDECLQTVAELAGDSGLEDYALLYSIKELKKTSMTYF